MKILRSNKTDNIINKNGSSEDILKDMKKELDKASTSASVDVKASDSDSYEDYLFSIVKDLAYRIGDVIDYYLDDMDFVITFNNRVDQDVLSQYAEKMIKAFRKAGIKVIDWNVNGSNTLFFMLEDDGNFDTLVSM